MDVQNFYMGAFSTRAYLRCGIFEGRGLIALEKFYFGAYLEEVYSKVGLF